MMIMMKILMEEDVLVDLQSFLEYPAIVVENFAFQSFHFDLPNNHPNHALTMKMMKKERPH